MFLVELHDMFEHPHCDVHVCNGHMKSNVSYQELFRLQEG